MFSNEFNFDESVTTVMDETGEYEDVQLFIGDDVVYIRQFQEDDNAPADLIIMTPKMFKDMLMAMELPEGVFTSEYKRS